MNTLTAAEIKLWANYRAKYGSLNQSNRQDIMLGQLLLMTASANGVKKVDLHDFVPWLEEQQEGSMESFFDRIAELPTTKVNF